MASLLGSTFVTRGEALYGTAPVGTSQTFGPGDWLIASSATAVIAASSGADVGAGDLILGQSITTTVSSAPPTGSGLSDTSIKFVQPTPDTSFLGTLYNSGGDDYFVPTTDWGQSYGLFRATDGNWGPDKGSTSDDKVRIVGLELDPTNNDKNWPVAATAQTVANPKVWFVVLEAQNFLSSARAAT